MTKITHPLQQNLLTLNKVCIFACKERIGATKKWPIKNTSWLELGSSIDIILFYFQGLTLQSAKNIVCVVLNAIRFSDIAKGQMVSAAKQLKVKCSITSSTKEDLAIALADIFVEKFVELQTEDLGNVDRESVEKLKVF